LDRSSIQFTPKHATSRQPSYTIGIWQTRKNGREEAPEAISPHYDIRLPKLPWHRRRANSNIAAAVFSVIRTVGRLCALSGGALSTRPSGQRRSEHLGFLGIADSAETWYARNRGIVVMNTTAFDAS